MNCDRVLQLLDEEPENWEFNQHTAIYKPTGQHIWTANGLIAIDFHPSDNGAFTLLQKWYISKALRRAEACRFGLANG